MAGLYGKPIVKTTILSHFLSKENNIDLNNT